MFFFFFFKSDIFFFRNKVQRSLWKNIYPFILPTGSVLVELARQTKKKDESYASILIFFFLGGGGSQRTLWSPCWYRACIVEHWKKNKKREGERETLNVGEYMKRFSKRKKSSPLPMLLALPASCSQALESEEGEKQREKQNRWCLLTNITHRTGPSGPPAGNTCCDLWTQSKWEQEPHRLQSSLHPRRSKYTQGALTRWGVCLVGSVTKVNK